LKKEYLAISAAAAILVVAVLAVGFSSSGLFLLGGEGKTNETVKIRMGGTPIAQGLPVFMAIDKNYFKEAGIDLEYTKFEAPNQLIDALLQDKLDFTFSGSPSGIAAIADHQNPGKLKFYLLAGGTKEMPASTLLIPIDSNITTIKDLNGKKLGIFGGSIQWRTMARDLLAKNGLVADKDTQLVELSTATQVPTLAAHQIDALLAIEPVTTIAKDTNVGKVLMNAAEETMLVDPFYAAAGAVNTKFAREHPQETKKVIEVIDRAVKEMEQNPQDSRKYLKGYTPLNDAVAGKIVMPVLKTCGEITTHDMESFQKFLDLFEEYKVVDGKLDAQALMYCDVKAS